MDQFVEQLRQVSPLSDEIVRQLLEEMKEVSLLRRIIDPGGRKRSVCLVRENRIGPGFRGA